MNTRPPVVVAYRTDWPERATALIRTLESLLGGQVDRIEHIGSTAIPGMAAKDVLDLQAGVPDLEVAGRDLDEPLADRGFSRSPYQRDHVPAGRNDDPAVGQASVDPAESSRRRRQPPRPTIRLTQ